MSVTNIIPCRSTKDDVGTATNRGFVIRMGKNTEWASYPGACRSIARGSTLRPTTGDAMRGQRERDEQTMCSCP